MPEETKTTDQAEITEPVSTSGPQYELSDGDYGAEDKSIEVCNAADADLLEKLINDMFATSDDDGLFALIHTMQDSMKENCPQLKDEDPELNARHKKTIARMKWHLLSRMNAPEVEELFRNHFEFFFEYDWQRTELAIRRVTSLIPDWKERDLVKKSFQGALKRADVKIGETMITVQGSEVEPTVENWMKDWREFKGDQKFSPLLVIEYLNTNANIKKIPAEDREKVEGLLKFHAELSLSSLTSEGSEQQGLFADPETGTYWSFEKGKMTNTDQKLSKEDLLELRKVMMRDEKTGKPLPISEVVRRSPFYKKPETISDKPEQKEADAKKGKPKDDDKKPTEPAAADLLKQVIDSKGKKKPEPVKKTAPKPVAKPAAVKTMPAAKPVVPIAVPRPPVPPTPPAPSVPTAPVAPVAAPAAKKKPKASAKGGKVNFGDIAQEVLAEHQLLLGSYDLEKRFLSVIVSYLKGVRDKIEARDALTKTPEEGGVNLKTEQIDVLLATADQILEQKKNARKRKRTKTASVGGGLRPTYAMAQKRVEKSNQAAEARGEAVTDIDKEGEIEDIFANISTQFDTSGPAYPAPSASQAAIKGIADLAPGSGMAKDQPLVMGPIDELRNMTLEEFRRFSPEPKEAAGKIVEKLDLLEQETIEKKAAGMEAWKESPLSKLYVELGNSSLSKSVPVDQLIAEMKSEGNMTLTYNEFKAIADLNKQIRF